MRDLRIVYMGTPDFAVPGLKKLVENNFNVVAVITAPDRPKGRGQKTIPSAVKEAALSLNLPVLQPTNLKNPEFIDELKSYNANLQVVVAFRMLPEVVWRMPEYGTFNLHASLLPAYRGAAPINWAIINGELKTGLTTFFLKHQIDTGNILFQEEVPILDNDSAGTLHDRLMEKGADLIVETTRAIAEGNYEEKPQVVNKDNPEAPKLFRENCEVKWSQPSHVVRNFIRGLSPYPGAWTTINGQIVKLFQSKVDDSQSGLPGSIATDDKTYLRIFTETGSLLIEELQVQGKRRMKTEEFFRGNTL